jgi:hypothetical protein
MTEKWTPGPWRYRPHQHDDWGIVKGADGYPICQARDARVSEEEKSECRATGADPYAANAHLIAAAPDLYAALAAIFPNDQCIDAGLDKREAALAALARARGASND